MEMNSSNNDNPSSDIAFDFNRYMNTLKLINQRNLIMVNQHMIFIFQKYHCRYS